MIRLVRICIRDYHRGRTHYFGPQSVRNTSSHTRLDISPSASSLSPVLIAIVFWKRARRAYYSTILAMILGALTTITLVIIGEQLGTDDGAVVFVWAIDPVLVGIPVTVLTLVIGTFIETRGWKDTEKVAVTE